LLREVLLPFLITGTIAAYFHRVGKHCSDKLRLKLWLRRGSYISVQTLVTNPEVSSTPTDLEGLRRLDKTRTAVY
jgi:hypothetical protein